jgi:hypothetical protein
MGVWDMIYLMQQYNKTLELAGNPAFSQELQEEFRGKAEFLRNQMDRYLQRVEDKMQKVENRDDLLNRRSSPQSP